MKQIQAQFLKNNRLISFCDKRSIEARTVVTHKSMTLNPWEVKFMQALCFRIERKKRI
jgi:hypothetical protein